MLALFAIFAYAMTLFLEMDQELALLLVALYIFVDILLAKLSLESRHDEEDIDRY